MVIYIIWLINNDAFRFSVGSEMLSMDVDLTKIVLIVGGIALVFGMGLLIFALICRIVMIRKLGNEEQKVKQKKNVKLSVILTSIAVGTLILAYLVIGVYTIIIDGKEIGYDGELFDSFEDFKDYMQTLPEHWNLVFDESDNTINVRYYTEEKDQVIPLSGRTLNIPGEMFSVHTYWNGEKAYEMIPGEYDCGNSFFIKVFDHDVSRTIGNITITYGHSAYLCYRYEGSEYYIYPLDDTLMTVEHPNEDGTGTEWDPVINICYCDVYRDTAGEMNTVVKTVKHFYDGIEDPVSIEKYIAGYNDSGKYEGKYGIFIYKDIYESMCFFPIIVWSSFELVYTVVAIVIFAIKYKKQKFGFEF